MSEPPKRLRALVDALDKAGVVAFASTRNDGALMTGLEFYELHKERSSFWLRDVYAHPFWEKVCNGTATRAQVIGFAFEKYHYIEAAFEHMGIAAANATPEMMPHLARHFIEEYTHGDIYRKGLRACSPTTSSCARSRCLRRARWSTTSASRPAAARSRTTRATRCCR